MWLRAAWPAAAVAAVLVAATAPGLPAGLAAQPAEVRPGAVAAARPVGAWLRDAQTLALGSTVVLEVPFVAQEPWLCGAAAVEMALRHAGARGVYARDFRPWVREEEGGIRTDELAEAVRARGWDVLAGPSHLAALKAQLAAGRPVTVLLAERPGRYHYVLVVGWSPNELVVHDPGRAPGLRLQLDDFQARWEAAGRWALTVLARAPAVDEGDGPVAAAAQHGGAAALERLQATSWPPGRGPSSLPPEPEDEPHAPAHPLLVEASDLFRASRWAEAAAAARAAALADPHDARAWALLGTSRYLAGDPGGALQAWNRTGEPVVDRVSTSGLRRTRHPVVHRLIGLRPGEALDAKALERARRRLSLLPSAEATALSYRALPDGLAEVDALAIEARLLPRDPVALAGLLLPALALSELRAALSSPTGGGEAFTALARWSQARPSVSGALEAPGFPGVPGVARVELAWERERRLPDRGGNGDEDAAGGGPEGPDVETDERTGARLALTDWASGWLRWEIAGGLDRWRDRGRTLVLGTEAQASPASGRWSVGASLEAGGAAEAGAPSYLRWALRGAAELLPPGPSTWTLTVRALGAGAGAGAPHRLRPGAGAGRAREGLLRAHPLEREGALAGRTVGTGLLNATLELERTLLDLPLARLGAAAFVDGARISGRSGAAPAAGTALHLVDGGLGLRLTLPQGRLRADAAVGSDGARALSLAWEAGNRGGSR